MAGEEKNVDELKKQLSRKLTTSKKEEKTKKKLDDKDLGNVSGGYWEDAGFTDGDWIECPICGEDRKSHIETWIQDPVAGVDGFKCLSCGYIWGESANTRYL